jgi:hypothetical protein
MRIENIIKCLKADKSRLEEKYVSLGLEKYFEASKTDKTWGAIHCQGVLAGWKLYRDRIEELRKKSAP